MHVIGFDYRGLKLRAMALPVLGRRRAAENVFCKMLVRWPQDACLPASRAHVRAQLRRRDGAIADARELVRLFPRRSAGEWFDFGSLPESAGRLDEAEAAFRQAVALESDPDRAWYGLRLTLICLQRSMQRSTRWHAIAKCNP
jgi:tetratricopeptide (TPR) repeat protein